MRVVLRVALGILCLTALASAQTAEELVAKNIQARGGLEKIKAVNTIRMIGKIYVSGFYAVIGLEKKRGNLLRQAFTVQGMTQIQAYDGLAGWKSPTSTDRWSITRLRAIKSSTWATTLLMATTSTNSKSL